MVSFGFAQALGFLALLSLIPLIILYLLKPKPKQIDVPSLMFFHKEEKKRSERAFLRRMRRDWLFLLQFLALLFLSLFFIQPYVISGGSFLLENTIIVLDTSASMGIEGVFDKAIAEAKNAIGKKTTLIIVSRSPYVALEDADRKTTLDFLDTAPIGATPSPLGSALMLASEYAKGANPQVFVISDFMETGGTSVEEGREILEEAGATVHLVKVGGDRAHDNIGIVNIVADEETSEVHVKNFKDAPETLGISIRDEERVLTLGPGSSDIVSFPSVEGVTTVTLKVDDDFFMDNEAYISIPSKEEVKVFLLSDLPSKYLRAALASSEQVRLTVGNSLPSSSHDVYVIHHVKKLDSSLMEELEGRVRRGAGLVIHVQPDSDRIDYGSLLPLRLGERKGFATVTETQQNKFTQGITLGGVQRHFATSDETGVALLRADNAAIISLQGFGLGKVAYYGILEEESDFMLNPGYPILWTNLVHYLGNALSVSEANKEGGSMMIFSESTLVNTPSGSVRTRGLYLQERGIYELDDHHIAVNLVSEEESQLASRDAAIERDAFTSSFEGVQRNLAGMFIFLALIFLFLELALTKARGEV